MILALEIWMTVDAWRKGWGPRALLPLGVACAVGLFVGAAAGANNTDISGMFPLFLIGDLACLGALQAMRKTPPQPATALDAPAVGVAALTHAES